MSETYAPSSRSPDFGVIATAPSPYPLLGFIIMVVAPTAFWTIVIAGVSSFAGATVSWPTLVLVASAIALFLTFVWSVMQRGRTAD